MPKAGFTSITVEAKYADAVKLAYQKIKAAQKAKTVLKIIRDLEK